MSDDTQPVVDDVFDYIWSTAVLGSELGDPNWNVNVLTQKIREAHAKSGAAKPPADKDGSAK